MLLRLLHYYAAEWWWPPLCLLQLLIWADLPQQVGAGFNWKRSATRMRLGSAASRQAAAPCAEPEMAASAGGAAGTAHRTGSLGACWRRPPAAEDAQHPAAAALALLAVRCKAGPRWECQGKERRQRTTPTWRLWRSSLEAAAGNGILHHQIVTTHQGHVHRPPCKVALICLFFTFMTTLPDGLQQRPARRSCATTSAQPAPTAFTEDGIQLQAGFACGAWVYDRGHGGQQRGYGQIERAADPADDGTAKWYVSWGAGGRMTAIKETYLEVALIPFDKRRSPTANGQRVLVLLGKYRGSAGEIAGKCGEMWRCKLDDPDTACQPYPADHLHATDEPPPDAPTFTPFAPQVLATDLAAEQAPAYLESLQFDTDDPVDLRRKKPDSEAWFDVLTGRQDIADLPDDDLRQLQYMAAGGSAKPSTKSGVPLAAEERQALVASLQRAAAGSWKMTFVCARANSCSCPYAIEFKHTGNGMVRVVQTEAHQFHDPSSAEDRAQLKMHPLLHTIGTMLLRLGVKPMQACNELNAEALRMGLLGSRGSALQHASNARASITLAQVKALVKQLRRANGYGLTSDANAIAVQLEEYGRLGCVPFFQPYRSRTEEGGEQPLIIILQTPFQQRTLGQFGSNLVFMDATFGTNKYGYALYALTVQDDVGRGVPVGFMICSSDTVEVVAHFLRILQDGARQGGQPEFRYGWVMIDNSKTEKAAVRLLVLTGDAKGFLLCYFHFLQGWERFLISKEAGVDKVEKNEIMVALADLMHCRNEELFKKKLADFCGKYRLRRKVVTYMKKDWAPLAEHWACWGAGRLDPGVEAMLSDTNNYSESLFRQLKYTDLNRNAQSSIQQLVDTLLNTTVPRCMQQRAHQVVGRASSDQVARAERVKKVVEGLVSSGAVVAEELGASIGRAAVGGCIVILGDMSCTCSYSADHVCVHIKAAGQVVGFTHRMRMDTAAHLLASAYIDVGEAGFCTCPTLADLSRRHTFRPAEGFCTCNDCTQHGTCCHLLAAPQLEAFRDHELLSGMPVPPGEEDKRIEIGVARTFQQAAIEPLGEDWHAEVTSLRMGKAAAGAAIQRAQTNADPQLAQLRSDAAFLQRAYVALPDGEARDTVLQRTAALRTEVEQLVAAAGLQPTEVRANKQQRRQEGRNPEDKVVKALHPWRQKRGRSSQAAEEVEPENRCDPLPTLSKKGIAVNKVRGVTVPGNVDGTLVRNGAAHHRLPKQQRQ